MTSLTVYLEGIKNVIPSDFQRKTRMLIEFPHVKATEHRLHLLYVFPTALRSILPQKMYNHYLLLHVDIFVNDSTFKSFNVYAEALLTQFVE